MVASTTLEEFLERSGVDETAERIQRIGLAMGAAGLLLATGVIVLALTTPVDRTDRDSLVRVAVIGGLVATFGAVIEVLGIADSIEVGWWAAFRDESGAAPMMRLLGALLIVFGLVDQLSAHEADPRAMAVPSVPVFALGGIMVGLLSFAFDGHTNSEGPRVIHALVDLVHVTAGGVWFGGAVGLAVLAARGALTGERRVVVQRFASMAAGALVAVTAAGIAMAALILDGFDEVTGTTWGRLLIAKTVLVAVTALLGAFHHFTIARPTSTSETGDHDRAATATLIAEAVLFVVVIAITAVLVTTSPN